jgi:hypothetical protein
MNTLTKKVANMSAHLSLPSVIFPPLSSGLPADGQRLTALTSRRRKLAPSIYETITTPTT